jgi:hypothetical protein
MERTTTIRHPDRSGSTAKIIRHPDQSGEAAQWRDLLFPPASTALLLVILREAKDLQFVGTTAIRARVPHPTQSVGWANPIRAKRASISKPHHEVIEK